MKIIVSNATTKKGSGVNHYIVTPDIIGVFKGDKPVYSYYGNVVVLWCEMASVVSYWRQGCLTNLPFVHP
jgi:hypothetical protein